MQGKTGVSTRQWNNLKFKLSSKVDDAFDKRQKLLFLKMDKIQDNVS